MLTLSVASETNKPIDAPVSAESVKAPTYSAGQSDTDFNPYWKGRKLNMVRKAPTTDISNTIQFVLEIDKLKGVLRRVRLIGEERYENVAEHSWQIALFAMSMARTLELNVDVTRVVAMLLVHDLGEIDAGDKFVFAQDGWEERKAAELRALERICGLAPRKTGGFLLGLWKEFDAGESDEARFAKAIDRSMPVLLNLNNRGGSWLENGVSYERVVERVGPEIESGCPELWEYLKPQLEKGRRKGFFATPDRKSAPLATAKKD